MLDEITYLFVDGGYLRKVHETLFQSVFGEGMSLDFRLIKNIQEYPLDVARRAFYYDCIDNIPNQATATTAAESDAECEARVKGQEQILEGIEALPGWQVREGYIVKQKKRGRVQKQVDVLLAVDVLNNAVRRNMTKAVLIAGDGDFVPVVQAVKEYGTYVVLVSELASTSAELRRTADEHRPIDLMQLCRWTISQVHNGVEYSQKFPQISFSNGRSHLAAIGDGQSFHAKGSLETDAMQREVSETKIGSDTLILISQPQNRIVMYRFTDPDVLRKYVEALHGPINWTHRM